MTIFFDSNQYTISSQHDPEFLEDLQFYGLKLRQTKLNSADLTFAGRGDDNVLNLDIGIELKKFPDDALASIRDKRWPSQLIRMSQDYDFCYLVLIGLEAIDYSDEKLVANGKQSYDYHYWNSHFLSRFETIGGRVRYVRDMQHAAVLIYSLYRFWQKEVKPTDLYELKKPKLKFDSWNVVNNPLIEAYYAMGIGQQRAMILADYCPNMLELALVPVQELARLPGPGTQKFGVGNAQKVHDFLTKNHHEKGKVKVSL